MGQIQNMKTYIDKQCESIKLNVKNKYKDKIEQLKKELNKKER